MESIPWLLIALLWVLNFAISFFNARTVGTVWLETKMMGGWSRFMSWMGAIMATIGFTWCYLIVLLLGFYYAQGSFLEEGEPLLLNGKGVNAGFALGYIIIVPMLLFSGLMIWIDSLAQAWRRKDLPSMGIAAWNTFAQGYNTYEAIRGFGGAWDTAREFFSGDSDSDSDSSSDDAKSKMIIIVIILVIIAILGGIFTTWGIITHYKASRPIPEKPIYA